MNGETTLQQRYANLLARIRTACLAAGRPEDSVTLLAVSKTFAAGQVLELAALGQLAFGESYLQEALAKIDACDAERRLREAGRPIRWHFIGPLQSNKTRQVAERFDWVHSVDRERIARRLSEQRPQGLPALDVCVQLNVSAEASKSGCAPDEAVELARLVAGLPRLRLRGHSGAEQGSGVPAGTVRARARGVRATARRGTRRGYALDGDVRRPGGRDRRRRHAGARGQCAVRKPSGTRRRAARSLSGGSVVRQPGKRGAPRPGAPVDQAIDFSAAARRLL